MSIRIIDHKVFRALLEVVYHPKMIALALWFAYRYNFPTITSGYRKDKIHDKDSGIHCTKPCRAIDFSTTALIHPEAAVDDINAHWKYDSDRPEMKCAVYHDVGFGFYLHLQVHENTVYLGVNHVYQRKEKRSVVILETYVCYHWLIL